ncbi:MAG: radical SAM protein [Betaproteobacteria bacterium]
MIDARGLAVGETGDRPAPAASRGDRHQRPGLGLGPNRDRDTDESLGQGHVRAPRVEAPLAAEAPEPRPALEALLEKAWEARRAAFGDAIEWVNPVRTAVLSVTGTACALGCAHCGGHYLRHMLPIARWRDVTSDEGVRSCLVSGGCDSRGRVPVAAHMDTLRELAARFRLNLHLGLADEADVARLAALRPVVSFDLVADDATVREVYGLDRPAADFVSTYSLLRRYVRVVPHICIGLRGGEPSGEIEALNVLARLGAEGIIFIVFVPTPGTRYASRKPPAPEEAAEVIARARLMFPKIPIYLGCMRPRGGYRDALDTLAVRAGVNRIVAPSPRAREEAESLGLSAKWREECCAL